MKAAAGLVPGTDRGAYEGNLAQVPVSMKIQPRLTSFLKVFCGSSFQAAGSHTCFRLFGSSAPVNRRLRLQFWQEITACSHTGAFRGEVQEAWKKSRAIKELNVATQISSIVIWKAWRGNRSCIKTNLRTFSQLCWFGGNVIPFFFNNLKPWTVYRHATAPHHNAAYNTHRAKRYPPPSTCDRDCWLMMTESTKAGEQQSERSSVTALQVIMPILASFS